MFAAKVSNSYMPNRRELLCHTQAGRQLSYQRHARRSEVWTVVSGEGEIVLDGEVRAVGPGSVVEVAPGRMHAARALSELRIVEVQLGDALVEEDIERFGSWW